MLQSEVSGLKAGLGLAGLGGEPLAKAAQLEQLEQRVTAQLDKANEELRAAQARHLVTPPASPSYHPHAEELRAAQAGRKGVGVILGDVHGGGGAGAPRGR